MMTATRVTLLMSCVLLAPAFAAGADEPPLKDYITKRIEWRDAAGDALSPVPIHINLLPDGRVMLFETAFVMEPTPFWLALDADLPDFVTVAGPPPPLLHQGEGYTYNDLYHVVDELNCAGHGFTEDGKLLTFGGTRFVSTGPVETYDDFFGILGLVDTLQFDPGTESWSVLAKMTGSGLSNVAGPGVRWYPTATRMSNAKLLVTSGLEMLQPARVPNRSVEIYDPETDSYEIISTNEQTPESIYNEDYTHVFLQPTALEGSFDMLMFGEVGQPVLMSTEAPERWRLRDKYRPGDEAPGIVVNFGTTSALLPLRLNEDRGYANGSVVMAGGLHHTDYERNIDIYDPVADAWRPSIDMGIRRHHGSLVLLPDGRVLMIAGHNDFGANPGFAQYLDPADGFSLKRGEVDIPEARGYHTVALLLPDGRILLGSGNDGGVPGNEKSDFRYYYPDYMLKTRPNLVIAPETVALNDLFNVITVSESPIAEVVMIALGSMTHSFDMNQRSVQLELVWRWEGPDFAVHFAKAPPNASTAPPGHYMLFALDENRVPSIAKIVKLTK